MALGSVDLWGHGPGCFSKGSGRNRPAHGGDWHVSPDRPQRTLALQLDMAAEDASLPEVVRTHSLSANMLEDASAHRDHSSHLAAMLQGV